MNEKFKLGGVVADVAVVVGDTTQPLPTDADRCDYCGAPIGFYGCPKHGTDCYNEELHPEWAVGDTTRPTYPFGDEKCLCALDAGDRPNCPVHKEQFAARTGIDPATGRYVCCGTDALSTAPFHAAGCPKGVGDTTQPQPTDVQLEPRTDFAVDVAERIIERLQGAVAEIRALHRENPGTIKVCLSCRLPWPCPTIAALDKAGCP